MTVKVHDDGNQQSRLRPQRSPDLNPYAVYPSQTNPVLEMILKKHSNAASSISLEL
jgi:hypothetical protein